MNKYQQQSIAFVKNHITRDLDTNPKYNDQITVFKTELTDYNTVWLTVETELMGLPVNSVLRALDHNHWHFHIGKRGKIEAYSYPDSYKQFKGQKVFTHIHVK